MRRARASLSRPSSLKWCSVREKFGTAPKSGMDPWDPEACSTVLTIWFDLGWVGLYMPSEQLEHWAKQPATWMSRLPPSHHPMPGKREARELLMTPSSWTGDRAEGWAALLATDSAPVADRLSCTRCAGWASRKK